MVDDWDPDGKPGSHCCVVFICRLGGVPWSCGRAGKDGRGGGGGCPGGVCGGVVENLQLTRVVWVFVLVGKQQTLGFDVALFQGWTCHANLRICLICGRALQLLSEHQVFMPLGCRAALSLADASFIF